MVRPLVATVVLLSVAGCARHAIDRPRGPGVPALLAGDFMDDYGSHFVITSGEWRQGSRTRYHVVRWNIAGQYLIARNDPGNPGDPSRWTRIDWMRLPGMAPYEWAFCLSAYNAPTAAAAEQTEIARRDTPRTGCNGFPFSRMQRAPPAPRRPPGVL